MARRAHRCRNGLRAIKFRLLAYQQERRKPMLWRIADANAVSVCAVLRRCSYGRDPFDGGP
jgi:hypothetical protein